MAHNPYKNPREFELDLRCSQCRDKILKKNSNKMRASFQIFTKANGDLENW